LIGGEVQVVSAILGQDRALQILENALRAGRFHHAWIFSGPRGVGKFTAAMQMARVLLDPEADVRSNTDSPLAIANAESRVHKMIDAGTHPDLHVIRKELAKYSDNRDLREKKQSNIPIDLLRERMLGGLSGTTMNDAPAYRTAAHGHGKVFIIDEAELLDPNAQNAMLKTLEEPPAQTYFFLITTQPDRLLITIRSRCQHVRFGALDDRAMRQWLRAAKLNADGAKLEWITQFAEGSPGIAQLAVEYGFYDWQSTLTPMLSELDRGKFPMAMGETLGAIVEQFAQAWVKAHGEKNTSKDAANKDGARLVLNLLAGHARSQLTMTKDDPERYAAAIDLIRAAERQLDSNVNLKLVFENLVVQWARAEQGQLLAAET
jgi:DNA polymerase III delta' subunit